MELHVVVQAGGGVSVALRQGRYLCWGDVRRTRKTPVELGGGGRRGRNITIPYPLLHKSSHKLRVQRSFMVIIFRVPLFGVQADMNPGRLFIVCGLPPLNHLATQEVHKGDLMWLLATATLGQSLLFHRYIHDSNCHSNLFHIYLTYLQLH